MGQPTFAWRHPSTRCNRRLVISQQMIEQLDCCEDRTTIPSERQPVCSKGSTLVAEPLEHTSHPRPSACQIPFRGPVSLRRVELITIRTTRLALRYEQAQQT